MKERSNQIDTEEAKRLNPEQSNLPGGGEEKREIFYGSSTADCTSINPDYPGIRTPQDLYAILKDAWCKETCTKRLRDSWSKENPSLGQCTITSFLAQDIFGGKVYGILQSGGNYHCYNVVGDCTFDLTSEQFGDEAKNLVYENNPEQLREVQFAKDDKQQRYEMLKERVKERLSDS